MKISASGRSRKALLSEINVTPFVDIMLVLLVIFMVTAPLLEQGIGIELPEVKSAGAQIEKEPFILTVKKDRQVYIGQQLIPMDKLSEKLKALLQHRRERAVYLQADKNIPYEFVAEALGEIKAGGVQNLSLITRKK